MRLSPCTLAITLTALLSACSSHHWSFGPTIEGSGHKISETRSVPNFDGVGLAGSLDLEVDVGPAFEVIVEGDDNLIEFVETEVRGDTLHIGMERGDYSWSGGHLRVLVRVPYLESASLAGSGDIDVRGVDSETFKATIAGSGDLRVRGSVDELVCKIAGSGDLWLEDLRARTAEASIAGSGDIRLHAVEHLDARISGSGDIAYRGDPSKEVRIAGSGSVTRQM